MKTKKYFKTRAHNRLERIIRKHGRAKIVFVSQCSSTGEWKPTRARIIDKKGNSKVRYYDWYESKPDKPKFHKDGGYGISCFADYDNKRSLKKTMREMYRHDGREDIRIYKAYVGKGFKKEIKVT